MKDFKFALLYIILILFSSCEKDITVDLPQAESRIVVDGYVEPGIPVYIILTRSQGFFTPVNPSTINISEAGAVIMLSNGTDTVQMTEVDSIPGIYTSLGLMSGEEGKTYSVNITTTDGNKLSASTFLPYKVPLDSLWFKVLESLPGNDSLGYVWAKLKDPDTLNNCYRWMAMRVGKDASFIPPIGSSFEDKFVNGTRFSFAYPRGVLLNSSADDDNNDEAGFYKKGDSVIVKWCAVDRPTFQFWRDAESQVSNNGSPFTSPAPVTSNIKGGLGLFASYSPVYYYLKIQ